MLFSSLTFLFMFLPAVIILHYVMPAALRNYFLLAASLFFYAWGEHVYVIAMLGIIVLNYVAGILLERYRDYSKVVLWVDVIANLSVLGIFKYSNFFIENINIFLTEPLELVKITMPIGISFYIFQSLSYTVDVYKKVIPVQRNVFKFALYVSMFPQLVAGPIVKYRDVMAYIDNRKTTLDDLVEGMRRFTIGLAKKVIIANTMGGVADKIFASGSADINTWIAWTGAIAYSLQIFFDFSGYSDMAIGLGRMFGFRFLENFNYPYIAKSMTDFWRRWHISLSSWFKEYVYIPLGGNRCSAMRHNINLIIVFFLTGLWHGASWSFVVWGLWHGMFLMVEKKFLLKDMSFKEYQSKVSNSITKNIVLHIYVIIAFVFGWVFFRADNLTEALQYIGIMCGIGVPEHVSFGWLYYVNAKIIAIFSLAIIFCYPWNIGNYSEGTAVYYIRDLGILFLLIISITSIAAGTYNPFIYFRF